MTHVKIWLAYALLGVGRFVLALGSRPLIREAVTVFLEPEPTAAVFVRASLRVLESARGRRDRMPPQPAFAVRRRGRALHVGAVGASVGA